MSMNPKNIVLLLQQSFNRPEYNLETVIIEEERLFALHLEKLIKESVDTQILFESFDSLSFNENSANPDAVLVNEDYENDFEVLPIKKDGKKMKVDVDIEYKRNAVNFWRSGKKTNLSFKTVQHNFNKVSNPNTLYKWEEQIKMGGTRSDKLLKISNYVLDQFKLATEKSLPVHDNDLKRWALQAREKVDLSLKLFTASTFWVHNFKIKHGIVSRKINKFITQKYVSAKAEIIQKSHEFVSKVKSEVFLVGENNVFNSDQSGFNLETHAGRTLALKGSMKVECLAQSLNSLTHSYTIQPIVSADGELKSPMLIVLQETGGKFGPIVEKTLYKAENIVALASKSGKLTSDIAITWFSDVFLPNAGTNSVLLLDSWTGQTKTKFDNIDRGNKSVKILTIPAGTTGLIQPLDVYGFRLWKNFLRQFSDIVILYGYDVNLHLRNNVLKIQSLIHNQFSSPKTSSPSWSQTLSSLRMLQISLKERLIIRISDRIKTSAPGRPQPLFCFSRFDTHKNLCIVRLMEHYINMTKELRPSSCDFLFISLTKSFRPVSSQTIGRWIKQSLDESGVDTTVFSAHSTRHASTSRAAENGVTLDLIKRAAGWTGESPVFANFYNRPIINPEEFGNAILLFQKKKGKIEAMLM